MDTFTDPRTALAFPAKIGSWVRQSVTTYPLQSAGYSVIYELRGWFGRRKALVSVDVYDKACPDIPAGPHSAHVAIELHNCIHAMFPNVPPVDAFKIDSYLAHPDVASKDLVGKIDATGRIRSAGGELTVNGVNLYFAVYILGHREHFVKFQESDLTKGACSSEVSAVLEFFLAQMRDQEGEKRGREIFAAAEGSYVERCSIVGLMMAIEGDEIAEQRGKLKPDGQIIFMMAYECCMMWAIKTGLGKVLKPEEVQSAVHTMQRHLAKNGWYQPAAFEKIWAQMEILMPIAMSTEPGAPPPYPVAEMLMAPNLAGYPIDPIVGSNMKFGIYVLLLMQQLTDAAELAAKEHLQGKKG